jgi:hypothetical protein
VSPGSKKPKIKPRLIKNLKSGLGLIENLKSEPRL